MDLDKQGQGNLSFEQLSKGIAHLEKDQTVLKKIFEAMDTDNNGSVDYCEFLAAVIPSSMYLREDYLISVFNMFDQDDSGKIDLIEISMILQGVDGKLQSKDQLVKYIKLVDTNGDGQIDFKEFTKMMRDCS